MKVFWVQMIDLDSVFYISRDVAMAMNFVAKLPTPLYISFQHSQTEWDNAVCMHD